MNLVNVPEVGRSSVTYRRGNGYGIHVDTARTCQLRIALIVDYMQWCISYATGPIVYTGWPNDLAHILYALKIPNVNRFSKLFYCQNQERICNNTITKYLTTPQVCRHTTLWNVSFLNATIENKTTSVTTYFKKLTTGNMFSVSVIV